LFPNLCLCDVFGVEDWGYGALFGDAVDGGDQVFDDVFKLALGFNYGAHAPEFVGLGDALDKGDGMALGLSLIHI